MRADLHPPVRRQRGFSLVELMVSVVIGLLALLFATRLVVSGERNKESALGGSDAMQNGMLALFSLAGDAGTAGWGVNDRYVAGCNTTFYDAQGYQLLTVKRDGADVTPLAAVVIQSNGADPDVISFNSGSSQSGVGSLTMTGAYTNENYISTSVRSPYGYNDGDVLVVASASNDRPCTLLQMAGFMPSPSDFQLQIANGSHYRFNLNPGMAQAYDKTVTYVYNLGQSSQLHLHTWSVRNGILQLRATDLAGAEAGGISVADNVVSIKAQYGFDTRVIPQYDPNPPGNGTLPDRLVAGSPVGKNPDGMQIGAWSPTIIDADHDLSVGSPGDYQRIAAVRIAIVARSKTVEKPDLSGQCSTTTALPVVFGSRAPADVPAVPVAVNVAVAGDPVSWKCYRYRVFETIVPILNSQYRP